MDSLESIAKTKTKYKTVVTQINAVIQERLDFYDDILEQLNLDL